MELTLPHKLKHKIIAHEECVVFNPIKLSINF